MATLDDFATFLAGLGIATEATDLFTGKMPDSPDTAIALYQYGGAGPEYIQSSIGGPEREHPAVQVVSRSMAYATAEDRAYLVWYALAGITNQDLSGTRYLSVRPMGSPMLIRRDPDDRVYIGFNALVKKEAHVVAVS